MNYAWLAGLLEGEGCFSVYPNRDRDRPQLVVALSMTDKDVVERAAALMNAPSVLAKPDNRHPEWKMIWRARVSGREAETVCRGVRPYLGYRRAAKVDTLLGMPNLSHRKP